MQIINTARKEVASKLFTIERLTREIGILNNIEARQWEIIHNLDQSSSENDSATETTEEDAAAQHQQQEATAKQHQEASELHLAGAKGMPPEDEDRPSQKEPPSECAQGTPLPEDEDRPSEDLAKSSEHQPRRSARLRVKKSKPEKKIVIKLKALEIPTASAKKMKKIADESSATEKKMDAGEPSSKKKKLATEEPSAKKSLNWKIILLNKGKKKYCIAGKFIILLINCLFICLPLFLDEIKDLRSALYELQKKVVDDAELPADDPQKDVLANVISSFEDAVSMKR